ncbi:MAG: MFS transporter [Thaumarchaeota archaeon]|nr:MFS transporter [Nitrososphaerota archaeon]
MQYKWVALSNTTLGILMASLDANIVLIALPTILKNLAHTSLFDLIWILLGYQLVTASVLVNFGRLADMFGRVRLYTFGFAVFTAGSALCSLSQTGVELVFFRMVQAIGAAFLFSNSAAIITDAFPANERGKALGINQISIVIGSVLGLVLGGVLSSTIGWQSIFWVNIPIGVFATFWSHYKLREVSTLRTGQKLDIIGNVTFATGLSSVLVGITLNVIGGLPPVQTYAIIGFGLVMLTVFFVTETRVESPMLDLTLFKIRQFASGNAAILLNSLARGAVTLVLVFYLQGPSMKLDALTAGLFLIPNSASIAFFGPISGWLSDRYGARYLATLGLLVSCFGFLLLANIGKTVTFPELAVPLVFVGSGMGIFAAPNRASIMNSVPPEERGIASGVSTTLVNLGSTLSLAVAILIMATVTPVASLLQIFVGSTASSSGGSIDSFITSVHLVYYVSTVFLLLAVFPSALRGKRPARPTGP